MTTLAGGIDRGARGGEGAWGDSRFSWTDDRHPWADDHLLDHHLEDADPDCIAPAAAAELLRDGPWNSLVVLGDSVAAGIRDPRPGYRDACFADRLAQALAATRPGFAYRNLGVRELRTAEIRDGQLAPALALRPDLAVVVAGGNDAMRRSFDPERVRRELGEILVPLAEAGALVVTFGLFDLTHSGLLPPDAAAAMAERFVRLNRVTAELTAEVDGVYVDTHDHPRCVGGEIFSSDRIHANAGGHAIVFAALVRALAARLRSAQPSNHQDSQH